MFMVERTFGMIEKLLEITTSLFDQLLNIQNKTIHTHTHTLTYTHKHTHININSRDIHREGIKNE